MTIYNILRQSFDQLGTKKEIDKINELITDQQLTNDHFSKVIAYEKNDHVYLDFESNPEHDQRQYEAINRLINKIMA